MSNSKLFLLFILLLLVFALILVEVKTEEEDEEDEEGKGKRINRLNGFSKVRRRKRFRNTMADLRGHQHQHRQHVHPRRRRLFPLSSHRRSLRRGDPKRNHLLQGGSGGKKKKKASKAKTKKANLLPEDFDRERKRPNVILIMADDQVMIKLGILRPFD